MTTKKNIRPQQVAPVQRETSAEKFLPGGKLAPQQDGPWDVYAGRPFAGDDAK